MPGGVALVFVRDGEHQIIVIEIARDLCAEWLRILRWWWRWCWLGRCCGVTAASTSATATATATASAKSSRSHTKAHLHHGHRMSGLRVHARVCGADVDVDVLEILLPGDDELISSPL